MRDSEKLRLALIEQGIDLHRHDLRHCVHEAVHALCHDLERPWTNDRVHAAAMQVLRYEALVEEVRARAVEQHVMLKCGLSYELDKWAMVSAREFAKHWGASAKLDDWIRMIEAQQNTQEVQDLAERILSLGEA